MASRKRKVPKYIASFQGFLGYFYVGLIAWFLNCDYIAFNEELFLGLNSFGFFFVLGLSLRKQTGFVFFRRAHRIFRIFRYIYRMGFRWLRRSVWIAYWGHIYVKHYHFCSLLYNRELWPLAANNLSFFVLDALQQQHFFFCFNRAVFHSKMRSFVSLGSLVRYRFNFSDFSSSGEEGSY